MNHLGMTSDSGMTSDQKIAFDKFSKLKVGALFMKMGTGKTRVALELADYNNVEFILYVAPFSTLDNVRAEAGKWFPGMDIRYVAYESISQSDRKYSEILDMVSSNARKMIIADESTFIKNDSTLRFNRLCEIRNHCEYALILNGTPLTKNEWDLYNQMFFLSPRIIGMSREEFLNKFFDHITYKKRNHKKHDFYKLSDVNSDYLREMIKPYTFQCDLHLDVSEEKEWRWFPFSDTAYDAVKKAKLEHYIEEGNSFEIINLLSRLNHISACDKTKNNAIADYAKNRKVIIFTNYLDECEYISERIGRCLVINGSTDSVERKRITDKFEKSDDIPLVLTFGCGSFSLNLQCCCEMIYSSLTFDFGKILQSEYRIKRIGQKNKVRYIYMLADCGINHMIVDNLDRKENLNELIKEKLEKGDTGWVRNI